MTRYSPRYGRSTACHPAHFEGGGPAVHSRATLRLIETETGVFVSASDTGTNPLLRDTDGDGHDDGAEVAAGSDPNDPASRPQVPVPLLGGAGRLLLALVLLASGSLARRLSRPRTRAKA